MLTHYYDELLSKSYLRPGRHKLLVLRVLLVLPAIDHHAMDLLPDVSVEAPPLFRQLTVTLQSFQTSEET